MMCSKFESLYLKYILFSTQIKPLTCMLNTLTNSAHWRCKLGGEVFNSSGVSLLIEVFNLRFQNTDVTVGGVCNIGVVNSKR